MMAQESVDGSMLKPRLVFAYRTESDDLIIAVRPGRDISHPVFGRFRCITVILPELLSTGIGFRRTTCDGE